MSAIRKMQGEWTLLLVFMVSFIIRGGRWQNGCFMRNSKPLIHQVRNTPPRGATGLQRHHVFVDRVNYGRKNGNGRKKSKG